MFTLIIAEILGELSEVVFFGGLDDVAQEVCGELVAEAIRLVAHFAILLPALVVCGGETAGASWSLMDLEAAAVKAAVVIALAAIGWLLARRSRPPP